MPFVVVSKDRAFTPEAARRLRKPIVMLQGGIHAGEIDGKDALLLLLRDLALGLHPAVLDRITLLVVPIYNVDGHERVSRFNRSNQDGPVEGMGFRTNARGLDLNRDHLKLDSAEARALVGLVQRLATAPARGQPRERRLRPRLGGRLRHRRGPSGRALDRRLGQGHPAGRRGGHEERRPSDRAVPRAALERGAAEGRDHSALPSPLFDRLLRPAQPALDPDRDALAQAVPDPGARQPRLARGARSSRWRATRARWSKRWPRRRGGRSPWALRTRPLPTSRCASDPIATTRPRAGALPTTCAFPSTPSVARPRWSRAPRSPPTREASCSRATCPGSTRRESPSPCLDRAGTSCCRAGRRSNEC